MNAPVPTLDIWPEQVIRGHSIPGSRYTCRDFMEKEWESMWTRVWLLLGREAELPEPGDWQMEPVGREEPARWKEELEKYLQLLRADMEDSDELGL